MRANGRHHFCMLALQNTDSHKTCCVVLGIVSSRAPDGILQTSTSRKLLPLSVSLERNSSHFFTFTQLSHIHTTHTRSHTSFHCLSSVSLAHPLHSSFHFSHPPQYSGRQCKLRLLPVYPFPSYSLTPCYVNFFGCLTTDAFAGFCLLNCLTDSNELFFVVILVLSYLIVSLVPY
jgi:hypothetical protein